MYVNSKNRVGERAYMKIKSFPKFRCRRLDLTSIEALNYLISMVFLATARSLSAIFPCFLPESREKTGQNRSLLRG